MSNSAQSKTDFTDRLRGVLAGSQLVHVTPKTAAKLCGCDSFEFTRKLKAAGVVFDREKAAERRRRFDADLAESPERKTARHYAAVCGFRRESEFLAFFRAWQGRHFSQWRAELPAKPPGPGVDFADSVRAYLRNAELETNSRVITAAHFGLHRKRMDTILAWTDTNYGELLAEERARRFNRAVKAFGLNEPTEFYQTECGYPSPESFRGFFKRWRGLEFRAWRKAQIKKGAADEIRIA